MTCRFVEGAKALDGQAKCLEDQILADVFALESGVTTEGSSPLVLNYDHINSITRNTKLLYICYFTPIGYLVPMNPRYCHNMITVAFYLSSNKGL